MTTNLMLLTALLIGCNTGEESKTDTGDTDPDTDTVVDTDPKVDTGPEVDTDSDCDTLPYGYDMDCAEVRIEGDGEEWLQILGLSALGDIDADGFDDFFLGGYRGAIFLGPMEPDDDWRAMAEADVLMELPNYEVPESHGYYVGQHNRVGDISGDGYDDLALYNLDEGGVMVLYEGGPDPGVLAGKPEPSYLVWGEENGDEAGVTKSVFGLDASDCQGILVSAYLANAGAGAVYLVEAPLNADMNLSEANAKLYGSGVGTAGLAVSGTGDVDGDGVPDALIKGRNQMWLSYGPFAGSLPLDESEVSFFHDSYINGLSIIGDTNGDGLADLAFVDDSHSDVQKYAGEVYVVLGGGLGGAMALDAASTARWRGEGHDFLGMTVDRAGDHNQDSYQDILVGAKGFAAVILGPTEGTHSIREDPLVLANDDRTLNTLAVGDFDSNGDGYADILLAMDDGAYLPGSAYLIYDRL